MTRDASVVRDAAGLGRLAGLLAGAPDRDAVTRGQFEDAALTATAGAVAAGALNRTESRGSHHRSDFPDTDEAQARSTIVRLVEGGAVVQVPAAVG